MGGLGESTACSGSRRKSGVAGVDVAGIDVAGREVGIAPLRPMGILELEFYP